MNDLEKEFLKSTDLSIKWKKYFQIYDNLFSRFRKKKITFVEVGISNGGSLKIWRNYFSKESRIIGIDLNPECKRFEDKDNNIEVFIGNQSDENFWKEFYSKVGNVDIILDDGGHSNLDQITTVCSSIEKINDNGMIVVEDTHTSYVDLYNSSKNHSFINFSKKLIDDINSNIKMNLKINFEYSLKKFVYSIEFYESVVVLKVDRNKTYENYLLNNKGENHKIRDFFFEGNEIYVKNIKNFLKKIPLIRFNKFTNFLKTRINNKYIKKYFK
tara:strand:- start:1379 stop:2191 length:813 start_codon:yes stop_codon:yes gene_type:complete